ncbi:MAG: hypothetical protein ABI867_11590 [Kofleriaceae bacterium]
MLRTVLFVLLVAVAPAFADTGAPHREGEYGGVAPGQPAAPKDPGSKPPKHKRPPPKGTLAWIGFEARDGGAQVFFQSVAAFDVKQHVEGSTLVVHLNLVRMGPNTWRQIDTRFFDNPIAGMVARAVGATGATKTRPARGRGIAVRVTFKNPQDAKAATVQTKTEPDGMFYAYLAFPEGTGEARGSTGSDKPSIKEPEIKDPEK